MASRTFKTTLAAAGATLLLGGVAVGVVAAQQPTGPSGPGGPRPGAMLQEHRQRFEETLAGKLGVTVERLRQAMQETRQELGIPPRPGRPIVGAIVRGGEVAAEAIGITPQELREELPGSSLADVARAHGKDPQVVIDALVAEMSGRVDQAMANGRLTTEQGATMKQNLSQRIVDMVNRQVPEGAVGPGPRGPRGDGQPGAFGRFQRA